MKNVMLVGGGKIGVAITEFLSDCGDYKITVADRDAASLARMPAKNVSLRQVEIGDAAKFRARSEGPRHRAVGDALQPDRDGRRCRQARGRPLSRSHRRRGIHARHQASWRRTRTRPSFRNAASRRDSSPSPPHDLAKKFDKLREVQMRVGALPVFPTNALKYNLTWSTDGLINEYCNPCESIRDGHRGEVPALEETRGILARRYGV